LTGGQGFVLLQSTREADRRRLFKVIIRPLRATFRHYSK
jgi:hypothetical protein